MIIGNQLVQKRIKVVTAILFIFGLVIVFRLFQLQILDYRDFETKAKGTRTVLEKKEAERGEIFLRDRDNLIPIATNINLSLIYAVPKEIENSETTAQKLSPILEISEEELLPKLSKIDDPYEILKHYVSDAAVARIKELEIKGIDFQKETIRFYPHKDLFAHLLGFVNFKEENPSGRYGLEGYYEEILRGKPGLIKGEVDAHGRMIIDSRTEIEKSEEGVSLILTINEAIQHAACAAIKKGVDKYEAESGTVIVLDPNSGKLFALCTYPSFDPNNYGEVSDLAVFNNPALAAYEPGSVFKAITMAAALDSGAVSPSTQYEDKGFVEVGKYVIKNADEEKYGYQTMTQVLEKSINTGAIFAMDKTGKEKFRDYVKNFGFGEMAGIGLNGDMDGDVSSLDKRGDIYGYTASFGQGITTTPLQLAAAFGAIVNQGKLMKPYVIDEIKYPDNVLEKNDPKMVREVISPNTSSILSAMLVSVIENGHSKNAKVKGWWLGGKTGTAQISNKDKAGYSEETNHTFVGFGPVDNPRFVILVKLAKPKVGRFASITTAPIFSEIAKFVLEYLEVPRDY